MAVLKHLRKHHATATTAPVATRQRQRPPPVSTYKLRSQVLIAQPTTSHHIIKPDTDADGRLGGIQRQRKCSCPASNPPVSARVEVMLTRCIPSAKQTPQTHRQQRHARTKTAKGAHFSSAGIYRPPRWATSLPSSPRLRLGSAVTLHRRCAQTRRPSIRGEYPEVHVYPRQEECCCGWVSYTLHRLPSVLSPS